MIKLSWAEAFFLYLLVLLLALFALWLRHHFTKKKLTVASKALLLCEYCHSPYTAELTPITRCPLCQNLNKNNLYR